MSDHKNVADSVLRFVLLLVEVGVFGADMEITCVNDAVTMFVLVMGAVIEIVLVTVRW